MNTQHTPGPWAADGYHVRQDGLDGTRMIADVCYTGPHHTPPDEYPKSCRIVDEANARLIAAAPDMLEALLFLMEQFDGPGLHPDQRDAVEKGQDAIAKATGKDQA